MASIGAFFSSAGRIGPVRVVLVTAVAAGIFWLVGEAMERGETITYAVVGAVFGAVLAKLFAEWARRLHDWGRSGYLGAGLMVAAVAVTAAVGTSDLADETPALYTALVIVTALLFATLLLWPGSKGSNRHDEPPTMFGHTLAATDGARRGMIWAIVSTIGGVLIGLALIGISHGMRDHNEQRMRQMEGVSSR